VNVQEMKTIQNRITNQIKLIFKKAYPKYGKDFSVYFTQEDEKVNITFSGDIDIDMKTI
jgi:hypothetical protein